MDGEYQQDGQMEDFRCKGSFDLHGQFRGKSIQPHPEWKDKKNADFKDTMLFNIEANLISKKQESKP